MAKMVDPMVALIDFQRNVRSGLETIPGEKNPKLSVVVDKPAGHLRYTYAKVEFGRVKAMTIFMFHEPIDGIVCFNIGYAVPEAYRGRGWGGDIVEQAIQEMRGGLARNGIQKFYVEAVVGVDNLASQKLAERVLDSNPRQTTDTESGLPALAYTRLVEC